MELIEVLNKRRSIRKFTTQPISEEQVQALLHAGMSGPSACNRMPWQFYVISNPEVLAQIRKATRFANFVAPLAIVVCGNLSRALPLQLADYWLEDCSAASENILLRATDLGLGSLWCGVYPQKTNMQNVTEILGLTSKLIPLNIIYIGYPDEEKPARDQFDEKKVTYIK